MVLIAENVFSNFEQKFKNETFINKKIYYKIMKEPEVKYINYGIGYCCEDNGKKWIELNKHLKEDPILHNLVLEHEFEHFYSKDKFDFMIDIKDMFNIKKQIKLSKFTAKHPSAILSNSPIFFEHGNIIPNWFMVGFWGFVSLSLVSMGVFI